MPVQTNGDALPISEERAVTRDLAVVPRPDVAPLSLVQIALEKGADPGYIEKLLDLQERLDRRKGEAEFAEAMNACQSEIPAILKGATNTFNQSKYARLEDVLAAVQPVYLRHGFALSFGQEPGPGAELLRIFVDVTHVSGCSKRYVADMPLERTKGCTAIQDAGKAFSYGRRYLLGMVFNLRYVTTIDPQQRSEDNDGQPGGPAPAPATITQDQIKEIDTLLGECKDAGREVDLAKLLHWQKVERLAQIRQDKYGEVLRFLNKKRRGETK